MLYQSIPKITNLSSDSLRVESLISPPAPEITAQAGAAETLLKQLDAPLIHSLGGLKIFTDPPSANELESSFFRDNISKNSFLNSRLDKFLYQTGKASLNIGNISLVRAASQPATSLNEILERRDAINELRTNSKLRSSIEKIIDHLNKECPSRHSGFEELSSIFTTDSLKRVKNPKLIQGLRLAISDFMKVCPEIGRGRKHLRYVLNSLSKLPATKSFFWNSLRVEAEKIISSPDYAVARGKLYSTFEGIKKKNETGFLTPSIPINFGQPDWLAWISFIGSPVALSAVNSLATNDPNIPVAGALLSIGAALGLVEFIRRRQISRFIEYSLTTSAVKAFDLIGAISSMQKFAEITDKAEKLGWQFPTFSENCPYHFIAEQLGNPCIEFSNTDKSVRNPVELIAGKPFVITGANSGGKTTFSLSIFQSHLLAQLGLPVPVKNCSLSVVDKFIYQAPVFAGLDSEGRFGSELLALKESLLEASDRSLVILDEIAGGTSVREQLEISDSVVRAFSEIGSGTVLVTHDHALARRLGRSSNAELKHFTPDSNKAVYEIKDGVAKASYAMRIAEKVGLTPDDVAQIVRSKKTDFI